MKNFNQYITEKLKINKDTKVKLEEREWLKACEKVIFDYLGDSKAKRYYNREAEVEYSKEILNIIFYDAIAYDTIRKFAFDISKILEDKGLIEEDYETDFYCLDNKWRIIISKGK